jgi:hypothetical protein
MTMAQCRGFTYLTKSVLYIADDVILALTKQAAEDIPVYKASYDKKTEVLKVLNELKDKAEQLHQKRQGELD